jgi:hypothetical protein
MPQLFSSFPKKIKEEYSEKILKPKSVVRIFSKDTNPPKIKRFAIIGESKTHFGVLIINTDINETIYTPDTYLHSLQKKLSHSDDCKYLEHDSYVDCAFIHKWDKEEVRSSFDKMEDNPFLGILMDDHWKIIIKTLKESRKSSVKEKKEFGIFLH